MRHRLAPAVPVVLGLLLVLTTLVTPSYAAETGRTAGSGGLPPFPTSPFGDPPGANDWDCAPTREHPTPVVLVHGTVGDRKNLLEGLSRGIKDEGFCVFSLDYGNRGLDEIRDSARELKRYVQRVLRATGAEKVSLVGHSQGGMMPRHFIKFLGGARLVDDLVGIAPSNHGTALTDGRNAIGALAAALVGLPCRSCVQQGAGSAFLTRLNRGDETPGRVSYTQVTTRYDQIVVPHTSGYLAEGRRTTNLTLQDLCPLSPAEHLTIPLAQPSIDIAIDALTRRGPADPDITPRCA